MIFCILRPISDLIIDITIPKDIESFINFRQRNIFILFMSKYIIALFTTLFAISGFSQSSTDFLSLTVSKTPNFTLNTSTLLENSQTITSAFTLSLKTKSSTCSIYASIPSGITTSASTSMAVGNVMLAYRSTTCPAASQNGHTTGNIAMSTSNTLLFGEKKTATQYNWVYDVIIPAIGYDYAPGTYNYTFKFTMTQP